MFETYLITKMKAVFKIKIGEKAKKTKTGEVAMGASPVFAF
jgi:hypothetical protein